ncbi:DUF536 domain-containing protein [Vagococcus fluvialis]|uniref:DUF536 domain-containing protein n=1 Tax=Vagococcus fluvialis TaxID=2738 RepID=UPI00289148B2|nr:DUF536 domain-containing protein [Vagococcus fluvialis]MDT2783017.1 DUF536 domain-containing protein [Vagococcus fluvialis]
MTVNTDMTIKELAEQLGISKQAVRRYFDQLPPSLIPTKKGGAYHINLEAQRFIIDKVSRVDTKVDSPVDTNKNTVDIKLDTSVDTSESKEIKLIQKEIIDDKNDQIKNLKEQIDKLHTLLDQQQQLTLQGNKQIEKLQLKLEHTSEDDSSDINISRFRESFEEQEKSIKQIEEENKQLKEKLIELEQTPKKGFWQRLFNS